MFCYARGVAIDASTDSRVGIPVQRALYGDGDHFIRFSLDRIAAMILAGWDTAAMKSFAGNILKDAGFPKAERAQMFALANYVKRSVGYRADAPYREQIQSAAITLCIDGAPVCIPIGDCDDFVAAVGTLLAAAGFHIRIVRQFFGEGQQEHVIIEAYDTQRGEWVPLDATTDDIQLGMKAHAEREETLNPLAGQQQMFVGIGRLAIMANVAHAWHRMPTTMNLSTGLGALRGDAFSSAQRGGIPGLHYTPTGVGALCDVDSVLSYKRRLLAPWETIAGDVEDCPGISIEQKTAFRGDLASFRSWYNGRMPELPFCGADQLIREGQDFEARLTSWRRLITNLGCVPSGPELPPLSDDDPRSVNYKAPESETIQTVKTIAKAVAVIGGIVVTGYGVSVAAPLVSAALSSFKRKQAAR